LPHRRSKYYHAYYQSPVGLLKVWGSNYGIRSLTFEHGDVEQDEIHPCLRKAIDQLNDFFHGKRKTFELTLNLIGSPFQVAVWRELQKITYRETVTYLHIAKAIGKPNASRPVGHAIALNMIPIIIPCHRVIGTTGNLIGYVEGIRKKRWLLEFENNGIQTSLFDRSDVLDPAFV